MCPAAGQFESLILSKDYFEFSPNPCPNLNKKVISHGSWICEEKKKKKHCLNDRTGSVCHLLCENSKVRSSVRLIVC